MLKKRFIKGGESFMKIYSQTGARFFVAAGALGSLLLTQGCIATRDWVKEQMDSVSSKVGWGNTKADWVR